MIVRGSSLITAWGAGVHHLPVDAVAAAAGCPIIELPKSRVMENGLRRASRECVIAIQTVSQALDDSGLVREAIANPRTAVIYASASAYAAANWAFLHADESEAAYFPYTAPSAVPGEVTIAFGVTGPYISLLSGTNAGIEAMWQAATLLSQDQCDRVLVLGVETFADCADLYTSGRWLLSYPLVETAVCLIVERHPVEVSMPYYAGYGDERVMMEAISEPQRTTAISLCMPTLNEGYRTAQRLRDRWPKSAVSLVNERMGTNLAAAPLCAILIALEDAQYKDVLCISRWGDAWSMVRWPLYP